MIVGVAREVICSHTLSASFSSKGIDGIKIRHRDVPLSESDDDNEGSDKPYDKGQKRNAKEALELESSENGDSVEILSAMYVVSVVYTFMSSIMDPMNGEHGIEEGGHKW